jgi:hypothetical protein
MNIDLQDLLARALKTFIQAFLATWLLTNEPFTKLALVSALAAAISATMTSLRSYYGKV